MQINDTNGSDVFKQALLALIKGANLYLLKKTETNSVIHSKTNIANVNLSLWEENAPEIDLICEISCNMGPFSDGKYPISIYSFHGTFSFLNLEIVANLNSCHNIYLIN